MPSLGELQADFRRAILVEPVATLAATIAEDGIAAEARLDVYRHHVLTSLTSALASAFPVVCRLVDQRFFAYAADRFVRDHPPAGPCLSEYGAELPDFLAAFGPCRHLVYLADVARLEWAMHVAAHADDPVPLTPSTLAGLDPARVGELRFGFDPSLTLLRSPWPIERVWRANQAAAGAERVIDLDAGGVCLAVARRGDEVVVRELDPAIFAFRRSLLDDECLATAAERARAVDPSLDLAEALSALLRDGVVISYTLHPGEDRTAS